MSRDGGRARSLYFTLTFTNPQSVLNVRRGQVISAEQRAGTPMYTMKGESLVISIDVHIPY
jgi:hypothetical protein